MATAPKKQQKAKAKHAGGRPRQKVPSEWGKRVERLAAKRGLSRSDLATKVGITYVALWQLIMGQTKPKMDTACRLADALGVPLDALR